MTNTKTSEPVVSDYNGYDYKKIFWEDADRKYEDRADRIAIRKLLPKHMKNFAKPLWARVAEFSLKIRVWKLPSLFLGEQI